MVICRDYRPISKYAGRGVKTDRGENTSIPMCCDVKLNLGRYDIKDALKSIRTVNSFKRLSNTPVKE
jgi:hypothetical protein